MKTIFDSLIKLLLFLIVGGFTWLAIGLLSEVLPRLFKWTEHLETWQRILFILVTGFVAVMIYEKIPKKEKD